ncbi:MAG: hypothetical protein IT244_12675 [Bacteroidia bacterium]|nr:hypothetical protein [Bacteroidia bacterium]
MANDQILEVNDADNIILKDSTIKRLGQLGSVFQITAYVYFVYIIADLIYQYYNKHEFDPISSIGFFLLALTLFKAGSHLRHYSRSREVEDFKKATIQIVRFWSIIWIVLIFMGFFFYYFLMASTFVR